MRATTPLIRECCEAVTSPNCKCPPGFEDSFPTPRTECYRCGTKVCTACSSVRKIRWAEGRKRICDNCLEDEPDGEAKVLLRRYHEAGYPSKTLAECQVEIAARNIPKVEILASVVCDNCGIVSCGISSAAAVERVQKHRELHVKGKL